MEIEGLIFLGLLFGATWLVFKIKDLGRVSNGNSQPVVTPREPPVLSAKSIDADSPLEDMLEPPIFDVMNLDTWQTNDAVSGRNYLE